MKVAYIGLSLAADSLKIWEIKLSAQELSIQESEKIMHISIILISPASQRRSRYLFGCELKAKARVLDVIFLVICGLLNIARVIHDDQHVGPSLQRKEERS